MKLQKILQLSFLQLCIVYGFLLLLVNLKYLSIYSINFILYSLFLAAIGSYVILKQKEKEDKKLTKISIAALLAFTLISLVFRAIPYASNSIPLGYDPGLYKYIFETYRNSLPDVPEESLDLWIRTGHPQGLFLIGDFLYLFGADTNQILTAFLIFFSLIIVLPLFCLTRKLFNQDIALLTVLLYCLSYAQFLTFQLNYYKNILGLFFLLTSFYFLEKWNFGIFTLSSVALGIFHQPTFLIFALIFLAQILLKIKNKEILKRNIFAGMLIMLLLIPFYLPRFKEVILDVFIPSITEPGAGTFMPFNLYELVSLSYLPFAFIGFIFLLIKKKFNILFLWFIINFTIVLGKLVFYNRLIIPLDILFTMLAGIGIYYSLLKVRHNKILKISTFGLLIVSGFLLTLNYSLAAKPLISQKHLEAMEWIKNDTEQNAFIMATSYDTPWVLGYGERKVIAPGFLDWNKWDKSEWFEFLGGNDLNKTMELLSVYDRPLYIYFSKLPANSVRWSKFNNFEKVYETNYAVVYKVE